MWRTGVATGLVVLAAMVLSLPHLPFLGPGARGAGTLRLVQINTLYSNARPSEATAWILSQAPDLVTLQEVSSTTIATYEGLSTDLPYGVICRFAAVGDVAIRSRHVIIRSHCEDGLGLVWAEVDWNGRPLTIASLHSHWPWPFGQFRQLAALEPVMRTMPRPVLLAGDFNAAPWSTAVRRIERATDSRAIGGFRITLPMGVGHRTPRPMLPLDHILLPEGARAKAVRTGESIGSDHLPVIAEVDF
jgi:endonuclease/exonuclease/phosphatase (EEP) superfamily protein YafD